VTDVIVRGTALRWESDEFPGWVEVVVAGAAVAPTTSSRRCRPVLTTGDITAASVFPGELWLSATYKRMDGDDVIVHFVESVTTTEGRDELVVAAADVRWL
jgi:hypothetical protein